MPGASAVGRGSMARSNLKKLLTQLMPAARVQHHVAVSALL